MDLMSTVSVVLMGSASMSLESYHISLFYNIPITIFNVITCHGRMGKSIDGEGQDCIFSVNVSERADMMKLMY